MIVRDLMTEKPVTVSGDESTEVAWHKIRRENVHQIPVTHERTLKGLVKRTDLLRGLKQSSRKISFSTALEPKVKDVMIPRPETAHPDDPIQHAADRLGRDEISALPVVTTGNKLVGILTRSDICRSMAKLIKG